MRTTALFAALICAAGVARGQAPDNSEALASQLTAATVTVRASTRAPFDKAANAEADNTNAAEETVRVASGVSLGDGLVVTFLTDADGARFRLTLADGEQAEAAARVMDAHSGLVLLEIERRDLPSLPRAAGQPAVGAAVLTAAAAGLELPEVSLGVVGGVDRFVAETGLPPLLQCDLRTTDTSSGAAVINAAGELVGLIAATPDADSRRGWTYAVPVAHVERLLQQRDGDRLVVLRQRRPSLGLTLAQAGSEGTVRVERIAPGGPADVAGVAVGDIVVSADGRKIRSAYQAVGRVLRKQPGDAFDLVLLRGEEERSVRIVLGDAATPAVAGREVIEQPDEAPLRVGSQLEARTAGSERIELRNRTRVAELAVGQQADGPPEDRLPRDEVTLLQKQLDAFGQVIERLQAELARRDEAQRETNELIKSLVTEVSELRRQLEASQTP